jgi:hypothetical protein
MVAVVLEMSLVDILWEIFVFDFSVIVECMDVIGHVEFQFRYELSCDGVNIGGEPEAHVYMGRIVGVLHGF